MAVLLGAIVSRSTTAAPAVLFGFISNDTRMMVQKAVDGATRRLGELDCQQVFADFSLDVPAPDHFAAVRFVDDSSAPQCARGVDTRLHAAWRPRRSRVRNPIQDQIPVGPDEG
jgi:hypothetical protein